MRKSAKAPTPAQINRRNRLFWREESQKFGARMAKRPDDAEIANEVLTRRVARLKAAFGGDAGKAIYAVETMEQIVADLAISHSEANRRRAKQPRPGRPLRSAVVQKMSRYRRRSSGNTLEAFVRACDPKNGEDVNITPHRDAAEYDVEYKGDKPEMPSVKRRKTIKARTLSEWWTEAGRGKS